MLFPGQKFASYEMKCIVSKIVRNFELSVSEKHAEMVVFAELVLRAHNGVILNVKKRKSI